MRTTLIVFISIDVVIGAPLLLLGIVKQSLMSGVIGLGLLALAGLWLFKLRGLKEGSL